ncbi:MAG: hypothetical protein ACYC9J_12500 [Sulfuricaulis sp.]
MKAQCIVKINWDGEKTAAAARAAIGWRVNVELRLPANYHRALSTHLYPEYEQDWPQIIDISGGAELLSKIARIDGLNEFAELAQAALQARARVQIQSSSPKVAISVLATAADG